MYDHWSRDSYQELIKYLKSEVDKEYKEHSANIINSDSKIIGNRIPLLHKIAKEISRGDYHKFIKLNTHKTFEETTLHGLVIGYAKNDVLETIKLLKGFDIYIDNWGTNDVVASKIKIFKKYQTEGFSYITELLDSNNPWLIRFGLILLLCHYINDDYIDRILDIINGVTYDQYYVKMANAWLISMCYVKYKDKTFKLIKHNNLDYWTHNKAIQKIKESYQVEDSDKKMLVQYKKARE